MRGYGKLIAWVFMPTDDDNKVAWAAPANYVLAGYGDVKIRLASDTPLTDKSFQPGWKQLDMGVRLQSDADLENQRPPLPPNAPKPSPGSSGS